jgi:hypothetical protein
VKRPLSGLDDGVRLKFTGPSGCAPDCPVSHPRRTCRPREKQRGNMAIIHWTVRWCTGLSGEPTVASAMVDRAIRGRRVAAPTVGRGHRTVRCAPDNVRCANGPRVATVACARKGRRSRTTQLQSLSGAPPYRRQVWPSKLASNGS